MIKATIPFLLLALFACSNSDNDARPRQGAGSGAGRGGYIRQRISGGGRSRRQRDRFRLSRPRATKRSASSTSSGWAPTATTQATISAATSFRRRPRTPGRLRHQRTGKRPQRSGRHSFRSRRRHAPLGQALSGLLRLQRHVGDPPPRADAFGGRRRRDFHRRDERIRLSPGGQDTLRRLQSDAARRQSPTENLVHPQHESRWWCRNC